MVAQEEGSAIGRLIRLDGLRGVLAVYVLAGHLVPFLPLPSLVMQAAQRLVSHGLAAVDLFFALSGLVIVQSMARFDRRPGSFLAARARRLLPVYLVVLASSILLMLNGGSPFASMPWIAPGSPAAAIWPAGPPPHPDWEILAHLAFLHGALPHRLLPDAPFALLGPAWSLSTEWQFYAVIAFVALGFDGGDSSLVRLSLTFIGLAVLARIYAACIPDPWRFSRAFLPNEAAYFALGIAAARFWQGERRPALKLFAIVLVVTMALGATHGVGWGHLAKTLPPLGWAAAVAAQLVPGWRAFRPLARLLGSRPVLWLGLVSYPLYLVNEPVGRALALVLGPVLAGRPALFGLCWGAATVAGSIGLAAALHYGIERRVLRRRHAVIPPSAVPVKGGA